MFDSSLAKIRTQKYIRWNLHEHVDAAREKHSTQNPL